MSGVDDRIVEVVKLSRPAQRALAAAGIETFADLTTWAKADVAGLHGIGLTSFTELDPAMAAHGLDYRAL
jgi:hypothetical protein